MGKHTTNGLKILDCSARCIDTIRVFDNAIER
jgi:hypothetical protein